MGALGALPDGAAEETLNGAARAAGAAGRGAAFRALRAGDRGETNGPAKASACGFICPTIVERINTQASHGISQ